MLKSQRLLMAGRPYTFHDQPEPEMDGHDNRTIGHLRNSRGVFAGYVVEMTSGSRLLVGGPSGISRLAEREALAGIEHEVPLETLEDVERQAKIGAVVIIHAPDQTWRLKIRKTDGVLPGNRAVGAWVSREGERDLESYVYLKPGSTGIVCKGQP